MATCRADTTWTGPLFGDWLDGANWTGGVPSFSGTATINSGFASLGASSNDGRTLGLILGATNVGNLTALGVGNNQFATGEVLMGRDAGSSALLSLGTGSFFQTDLIYGTGTPTPGQGAFTLGLNGAASVTMTTGAQLVTTGAVKIGANAGSSGNLTLNGGTYNAVNHFGFDLALAGSGTLTISNGGKLNMDSGSQFSVGRSGGIATVSVTGAQSLLQMEALQVYSASSLSVGNGGAISMTSLSNTAGQWTIDAGGSVTVASGAILGGASQLTFSLTSSAPQGHGILNAGSLTLDGALTVDLAGNFVPQEGNQFQLLASTGAVSGQFNSVTLAPLPAGLVWDTSALYTTGTVGVVPEPAAGGLLTAGLIAFAGWRVRRGRRSRERANPPDAGT